jgi:hypothetical protein
VGVVLLLLECSRVEPLAGEEVLAGAVDRLLQQGVDSGDGSRCVVEEAGRLGPQLGKTCRHDRSVTSREHLSHPLETGEVQEDEG